MNVQAFLDTMLPSQGLRIVTVSRPPPTGWPAYRTSSTAKMVQIIAQLDARGENVFYALGGYAAKDAQHQGVTRRKQFNVVAMRCFFVDLDVGQPEPGKRAKYLTQKAAAEAICRFALTVGLPLPWLVSSGTGLHAYWPVDEDIPVDTWKAVAEALKAALTGSGILYDPARTADAASVLRPPGAMHRKDPKNPLPVVLKRKGTVSTLAAIMQALVGWVRPASSSPAPVTGATLSTANAALGGGMGYDPSSALQVADQCAVIGLVRDTLGKVDQPTWYYSLGVLMHTDEAPDICHDWSKGDPRYNPAEVDANLNRLATVGATTCAKLAEFRSDLCAACPHNGHIKSPIVLGRGQYTPQAPQPQQAAAGGGGKGAFGGGTAAAGPAPAGGGGLTPVGPQLPDGFRSQLDNGRKVLARWIEPTAKEPGYWLKFCDTYFIPVMRLVLNGEHYTEWLADDATEVQRAFRMRTSILNKGGKDTAGELGLNGIVTVPGQDKHMDGYLKRWAIRTNNTPLIVAHPCFGWSQGYFVTGEVSIAADGSESPAVTAGIARSKQAAVTTKGSLDVWKMIVDRAYNAPGQEAFQFQLLCAFAAPLLTLMQQVQGVTVYAHSPGSGVGKTTVQKVALSAWGDWRGMMLAQNKATANALWGLMGAYNTLPVVYDELTNARTEEVSDLVYSVSSGRMKERMTNAGEMRENNSHWTTILLASGNTLLTDKLAGIRGNPEAEMSRLFEFTQTAPQHLTVQEANDLFPLIDDNYGHAGLEYARYLVKHRAKIATFLAAVQKEVVREYAITQVERHWSALFTCILASREFCRRIGLMDFPVAPLKAWMGVQLAENRGIKAAAIVTIEDHLQMMIADMMQHVLITNNVGNLRLSRAAVIAENGFPRSGNIRGRLIRDSGKETQLWLARPDIRQWCRDHGVTYRNLHDAAVERNWCDPVDGHQLKLGVGTEHDVSPIMCWKLFPDRMSGSAPVLSVIQGGQSLNAGITGTP